MTHQILYRSREGTGVLTWNGSVLEDLSSFNFVEDTLDSCWSSDGSSLFVSTPETINVYSGSSLSNFVTLSVPNLAAYTPSPSGAYVASISRPVPASSTSHNFFIHRISDQKVLFSSFVPKFNVDQWPYISFSADERFAVLTSPQAVSFLSLSSSDQFSPSSKLPYPPSIGTYHVIIFIKQHESSAHLLLVLSIPSLLALSGKLGPTILHRYVVGNANDIEIHWSYSRTHPFAIVLAAFDVDTSNTSYHGINRAFYVPLVGSKNSIKRLSLPDGPTHSVTIHPKTSEILVLAGFNPCVGVFFDHHGNQKDVHLPRRNQSEVKYSPGGSLIAVGGFGNLRSGYCFYKTYPGISVHSECPEIENVTSWSWLVNGSGCLIATTCPRLRVGNFLGILGNNCEMFAKREFDVLYTAVIRPFRGDASQLNDLVLQVVHKQKSHSGAYLPPSLRDKVVERTTTSLAELGGEDMTVKRQVVSSLPPGVSEQYLKPKNSKKKKKKGGKGGSGEMAFEITEFS
ncbi:hypothetical protein GEMRC1_007294 [Eukaryota sp. GEM-RC1]